jgi:hypothetical protein|tara:strand:+ start:251 stop:952 length:702 start_codon:yes stop_codon:yes gene_type:complete
MAVSVDTVYQTVLSTLNKEQRGYVTPQEFNLFAEQAQLDIFEQYFYDINQFGRLHGNSTEYSDMLDILEEKLSVFEAPPVNVTMANTGIGTLPTNYRLGNVMHTTNGVARIVEKLNKKDIQILQMSPLTTPNLIRPAYTRTSESTIQLYPATIIADVTCDIISKPTPPNWNYVMVYGEALYNATGSTDFQLHQSEEIALVEKILEFAGLSTKEVQMYQIANQEEMQTIQQEKQ